MIFGRKIFFFCNAQFCTSFSFPLNCVKSKIALYCISSDIYFLNHVVFIETIFFLFNVNSIGEIYSSNYKGKFCQNAKLSNTVGFTLTRSDKTKALFPVSTAGLIFPYSKDTQKIYRNILSELTVCWIAECIQSSAPLGHTRWMIPQGDFFFFFFFAVELH